MRVLGAVGTAAIQDHLRATGTGVSLDLANMPGRPTEYVGSLVELDASDANRIYLWFEFEKRTRGESGRLVDINFEAGSLGRVRSFAAGDAATGKPPVDLLVSNRLAPIMVSNDQESGVLYLIDGNHRMIAHWLRSESVAGVQAYLAVHPELRTWPYVAKYCLRWNAIRRHIAVD